MMAGEMLSVSFTPNPSSLAKAFTTFDMPKFLGKEINALAMSVERYAKQLTPVDTGRLRASIHTSPGIFGLSAVVSTNTDYAIYVHDGTKYMAGRPFMIMGAAFAQVNQLQGTNQRLDAEFVKGFKSL